MDSYRKPARLLKLMAHPIRLQILDVLCNDDECVCHLSAVLAKPQPYVSQQLAVLRNAGMIVCRKEGTNAFYRLVDEDLRQRVEGVLVSLTGEPRSRAVGRERVAGCCCPKCSM